MPGSWDCVNCEIGRYSNQSAVIECVVCPYQYYNDDDNGNIDCKWCDLYGKYSVGQDELDTRALLADELSRGIDSELIVEQIKQGLIEDDNLTRVLTGVGTCNEGRDCIDCPAGKYNLVDMNGCLSCSGGQSSGPLVQFTYCNVCPDEMMWVEWNGGPSFAVEQSQIRDAPLLGDMGRCVVCGGASPGGSELLDPMPGTECKQTLDGVIESNLRILEGYWRPVLHSELDNDPPRYVEAGCRARDDVFGWTACAFATCHGAFFPSQSHFFLTLPPLLPAPCAYPLSVDVKTCIHPFACKGGIAQNSTDDYCHVGYTGIMCGVVSAEWGVSLPA